MTREENLKQILEAMPSDTPEITHIILKSQVGKKHRHTLQKRR